MALDHVMMTMDLGQNHLPAFACLEEDEVIRHQIAVFYLLILVIEILYLIVMGIHMVQSPHHLDEE